MPSSVGPNTFGEENLVFGYDLGDTVNSYRGEPTVNVLNNNILGQGSGAFLSSDSIGAYIQLADLTSGYSRFQLPSIPVSSNDTYTWSFELMSPETITTNFYFDTNEYSDQFPASNDLSRASATARVPSTMPAGVWQQFSLTVTMKPDLTGAYTYDFFNMLYPTFQNKKVYYRNMQFEFKNHPTQYAGQGVTRSATQGLIDLTGNSTIDLSNVSFDSNAQMTFDGTDDFIEISDHGITDETRLTISYWFKMNWLSSWSPFITLMDSNGTQKFHTWFGSDRGIDFQTSINSVKPMFVASAGTYPNNDYINIVMTVNGTGSNNIKCYINGEYKAQGSVTFNTANITNLRIGRDPNAAYGGGDLPNLRIHNRALTASEIRANYNAIKGRFNI
jgi:hypothetical protein